MLPEVRRVDIRNIFGFIHHGTPHLHLSSLQAGPGDNPEKWCPLCGRFQKRVIRKEHEATKRHKLNVWCAQMRAKGWARMYEGSRLVAGMMDNQLPDAEPYMVRGLSNVISTVGEVWWGPWWMGCIAAMTCVKVEKRKKVIRAFLRDPDHVEWMRSLALLAESEPGEDSHVLAMVEHVGRLRL